MGRYSTHDKIPLRVHVFKRQARAFSFLFILHIYLAGHGTC